MPQSLAQIYLHIIFSTKNRAPLLCDPQMREAAHGYVKGILDQLDCPRLKIGGVADHIHILCRQSKNIAVADLLRELKRDSSKQIKTLSPQLRHFSWQLGYGAFSVSPSHIDNLCDYIANQEEHHRHESFQDEFRRICQKYGIEIDERYAWD